MRTLVSTGSRSTAFKKLPASLFFLDKSKNIKKLGNGAESAAPKLPSPKECLVCLSGIDETVKHMVCECPAYGRERKILIKNIGESAGARTWSRECGDNEDMFKPMVGMNGKATDHL